MSDTLELLPCPRCGCEPIVDFGLTDLPREKPYLTCPGIRSDGESCGMSAHGYDEWNAAADAERRIAPSPSDAEVLRALLAKVEACEGYDWQLDEDVLNTFGHVRRVARLGLTGRTRGSDRYFGPNSDQKGRGSPLPKVTKDAASRAKWADKLRALIAEADQ